MTTIDYPRTVISDREPMISGSKIPVRVIVRYYQMGMSEAEILNGFPQLEPADIFSALAFYFENKSEMDSLITEYGKEYDIEKAKRNA